MATEYQIIEDAPTYCAAVAHLASWSGNYDHPTPFALFLDIVGYSEENYGEPMFDLKQCETKLGYLEIGMLAEALTEYSENPRDVSEWIDVLMHADGIEENPATGSDA